MFGEDTFTSRLHFSVPDPPIELEHRGWVHSGESRERAVSESAANAPRVTDAITVLLRYVLDSRCHFGYERFLRQLRAVGFVLILAHGICLIVVSFVSFSFRNQGFREDFHFEDEVGEEHTCYQVIDPDR